MNKMYWQNSEQIQQQLESVFDVVLRQRMQGIHVVNPELQVQALDFQIHRANWTGILITPWFMNLLLLPGVASEWQVLYAGEKTCCSFPSGNYEFTVAHENGLGTYAACSLYSPMFQFQQQTVVVATAQAAWRALFKAGEISTITATKTAPRTMTRRDLLRGTMGSGKNAK